MFFDGKMSRNKGNAWVGESVLPRDVCVRVCVSPVLNLIGQHGPRFSLDTESGFKDVVFVTAAWGLGETVVGGTVNPDEWRPDSSLCFGAGACWCHFQSSLEWRS